MDGRAVAGRKKKARRQQAWIAFQDESGISERPPVRRTWAPRGETPVLIHAFNWKKMSASAVLAYRWDGKRSQLFFQVKPDSYNTDSLIAFLADLRRHFRGRKVILIWDGLPSHRSREMTDYLRRQTHWLIVERLPGYAPDLNPVEYLWGNVKGQELANLCADNLGHATSALCTGMTRVRHSRQLCFSFLRAAGLSF